MPDRISHVFDWGLATGKESKDGLDFVSHLMIQLFGYATEIFSQWQIFNTEADVLMHHFTNQITLPATKIMELQ